jgi:hypothetical protein
MNTNTKLEYHPLIKLYANSFASIVAGILGWRLINLDEFISFLEEHGANDGVALASQVLQASNQNVTFSFRKSVQPLVSGESDHHRLLSITAQQLIGHSWEVLRINGHVPAYKEPVLEFFRHIRNGCFHGNSFHFKGDEPRNPAQWRGLEITKVYQGKRIFRTDLSEKDYFINWGDTLLLLHDVSQLILKNSQAA